MIAKPLLRKLVKQKLKDAEALISKKRYYSSIYISGYAIELALKHEICKIYKFKRGFPETSSEFNSYTSTLYLNPYITINDIRNHNLQRLLQFSGAITRINSECQNEWNNIITWNPEIRYKILTTRKNVALVNLDEVKIVVNIILRR
ncbi:MAG TPA: hypothetical protein VHP32_03035 [Ignavibacteria bacterium]|nr:hypothetical protein [Ignavibacteria bacterium]